MISRNQESLKKKVKLKPQTCFWSLKSLTCLLLTITFALSIGVNLSTRLKRNQDLFQDDISVIFYYVIVFVTVVLSLALVVYEKAKVVTSSLPHVLFWPLVFLTLIPVNLEEFTLDDPNVDKDYLFITLNLPSVFCLFVSHCFADLSSYDLGPGSIKVNPTKVASHMSRLTVTWLESLIWMGYRNPLMQKDLPPAQDNLEVKANVETFIKNWEDHVT